MFSEKNNIENTCSRIGKCREERKTITIYKESKRNREQKKIKI